MRSFGFQIWLERRSSRFSVFYFGAEVKFGASVDVGRAFPRFRPVDPPTNDTRRYEAKEASPLGELSSETDVFPGSRSVTSPR